MKRLFYLLAAAAFTACGSATTLSVMTFNMRYDNPEDGADNWRFRRGRVAEVIASHGVDVFGTQELLANQLGDLKRLLPGYAAVGVGREDGAEAGEFSAVFYRRDRFTPLESGTFWLSETLMSQARKGGTAPASAWQPGSYCMTGKGAGSSSSSTPTSTM